MQYKSQYYLLPWNVFKKSKPQVNSIVFVVITLIISSEVIESQFQVKTLPGLLGDLPFTLETGYTAVDESKDVHLFYYFIKSERDPEHDPLMLWLTGGPGCSGLSGLLFEIGPFTFNYENSSLEEPILEINPYSWTKAANVLFLDQPVGTGFSYAKTSEAYIMNDTLSALQTYGFLRKWLVDHPEFLNNPLYIGGDSYCGIVLPMIVLEIYNGNEVGEGPIMNIKGYLLGNPLTETSANFNSRIPFAHRMALLSDALYKSTKDNCHGEYLDVDPDNILCVNDLQAVEKCLGRIRLSNILEPFCESAFNSLANLLRRDVRSLGGTSADTRSLPHSQKQWCRDDNYVFSYGWANRRDVQEALNVHKEINNVEWVRCNASLHFDYGVEPIAYTHNIESSVDYHRRLADKNCRALIYSGDHDMVAPYLNTLDWIESLNLGLEIDWTPWFVQEQVAGYTMKFTKGSYNLTFATVKGGGHTAPEFKPEECLNMLVRWFDDDAL